MEEYSYKIHEETELIEEQYVRVFGISAFSSDISSLGCPVCTVRGITSSYTYITEILSVINIYKPSPVHLKDVIEDILAK